jgi:hypothetical protein
MNWLRQCADRLVALAVPAATAAAACYAYTESQCTSSRCSNAPANPRLVQSRWRTCYSPDCERGCDPWNYAGCCSI